MFSISAVYDHYRSVCAYVCSNSYGVITQCGSYHLKVYIYTLNKSTRLKILRLLLLTKLDKIKEFTVGWLYINITQ